jgi:hypothetical protein
MTSTVSPSNSNEHQPQHRRESFRCPADGPRRHGRIIIGRRNFPARILDESAGGFGIELDVDPGCEVGDTLLLEVATAWTEVRVLTIQRCQPAPDDPQDDDPQDDDPQDDDPPNAVDPTLIRLSVERLRDVEGPRSLLSWSTLRSALATLVPLAPLARSFQGMLAAIVYVVVLGTALIWVVEHPHALDYASWAGPRGAAPRPPRGDQPFFPNTPSTQAPPTTPPVGPPIAGRSEPNQTVSTQPPPQAKRKVAVTEKAIRLAQPDFLLQPDVAGRLSLHAGQREQLRKLYQESRAAADAASGRLGADGTQADDDARVRLGRKVLGILTDEQRQLFVQLYAAT